MLLSSLIFSSQVWAAAAANLSLLEEGSHCVAYKAEKTMFLVSSGEVVGKNCDVSAQILPDVGGIYHIEVNIPIRSFQSGDTDRDEDVAKTLKAGVRPEITFRSKALSAEAWHALFAKSDFEIQGELLIGDKVFPVKLASRYFVHDEQAEVDGIAKVKFADFEITPPKVVGGIVAKTKPDFELHFHLLGSRILGADSIRLEKK
ncbi:MAG: YceI family protein [Bdellovibrionales bacterium]